MSIFSRSTGTTLPTVDVTTAHNRPTDVLLLDVREPAEWAGGHAPAAHHQPLGELDSPVLPAADTIYVICQAGGRSERATRTLRRRRPRRPQRHRRHDRVDREPTSHRTRLAIDRRAVSPVATVAT